MKTIGLIGGMSWESTAIYYRQINEEVKARLGGLHSAKLLLYSVDFQEIEACQAAGDWARSADILTDAAIRLERAGADFLVICTNTMHKVAPEIQASISIPILHIAQATAQQLLEQGVTTVGLLGTRYTMTQDFYRQKLTQAGIQVILPQEEDLDTVHRVIYDELCQGIVSETSRAEYLRIISKMKQDGAQGVILGCTEIGLLIRQSDVELPVFDTTLIHSKRAALEALL
ncbi:MAG TPA: aspartate/glutamate racemase family protein [Candidatus Enterenecus merdae]|nr:aspartate/glutamate racemase family protein [Candidatus Enterenecus merdae]